MGPPPTSETQERVTNHSVGGVEKCLCFIDKISGGIELIAYAAAKSGVS
jgi:hypothetical protein